MKKQLTLVLMLVLAVAMVGTALTYAGGRGFRSGGPRQGDGLNLRDTLSEEQQTAIHELVTGMREGGDTRETIRTAVRDQLTEWGIEAPEMSGPRPVLGDGPFASLTDEERSAIRETVATLKAEEASPEVIRATVREMLEGYGVELPEDWGEHPRLRRTGLRRLCADLTEDQRTAIREMVTEMREAGTPREEVRAAVREMLEEYGVELPEVAAEETVPDVPLARISTTTAVQSTSWGQIKSRMK